MELMQLCNDVVFIKFLIFILICNNATVYNKLFKDHNSLIRFFEIQYLGFSSIKLRMLISL